MAETTRKTTVKKAAAPKAEAKATPTKTAAGPKAVAPKKASVKKTPAAPATNLLVMPSHEDISRRAYELWAERGFSHGDPNHDWARAEHELRRA